ncbi:MAG: hypothetical protein A2Y10_06710 [Planctomycetes bacterium GWF2_41_51]|nr:MAG: hypothetical protein A2Y10_06710 [Planctomycetes bacterium GWF2_41_51]HBG28158.1 hypothetical protein [Phycisphaerales bacterium]
MKKNIQIKKSASQIFFVIFLCIIAFRLSFTENVSIESFSLMGIFFDNLLSISISSILILASAVWMVIICRSGKYQYKYTGFEIGAFLFFIAAVISTIFASNKRASMNDALTIAAAIVSAITIVQLLDSEIKKKALVFFVIAMAAVNVYQCTDQFFSGNKMMIEQYNANPQEQLRTLGIEPGSFQQMLYEHRLQSKDVKGFFATSNSAGCFFNLAIFSAIAVFGSGLKRFREKPLNSVILPIVILLILFAGLLLTASKGAFVSFFAASFVLMMIYAFHKFFIKFRFAIICLAGAGFLAMIFVMISYGLKHDTLPGGNSMLVRWEYWTASAEMIADNFFTGIGGNNFGTYYTHYKIPQALETVRDPHCFILTIFSTYGIVGLAGFCTCLFLPIYRSMKNPTGLLSPEGGNISSAMKLYGIAAVWILLFLRPLAIRSELGGRFDVAVYIIAIMYAAPVFVFGTTLWLCTRSKKCYEDFPIRTAPLLCGVFAVLLHNLIDFGIFEPGILTATFAITALGVSQNRNSQIIEMKKPLMYFSIILTVAIAVIILWLFIIPVGKTAMKVEAAKGLSSYGYYDKAANILNSAERDDKFDPNPAALNGLIKTYNYRVNPSENKDKLLEAEKSIQIAIARDPADFKNYENASEVYQLLAESNPNERLKWFKNAYDSLHHAIERYPSSAELHLKTATIAQQLDKIDDAIEHYTQTIAIEDAYREEFKIMYPGKDVFSRVGEVNYRFAKLRLEQLKQEKDANR